MNFYRAELAKFDDKGIGVGRCWGFCVSPEKCNAFTIEFAKELLTWGSKEFKNRFGEEINFNFISLKMGDTTGKYWKDKNKLLIYKNDLLIYENNNGIICRDSVALSDG